MWSDFIFKHIPDQFTQIIPNANLNLGSLIFANSYPGDKKLPISTSTVQPPLTSVLRTVPLTVTKFDERNAIEHRDVCRNFSIGDLASGEFATPNYPQIYPSNLECVKVIHAPIDYTILLDFRGTFFEIEQSDDNNRKSKQAYSINDGSSQKDAMLHCPFDYLEVRNGAYGFSPLIGRYCGNRFPPVIAADSGSMWLLFKSDHTIQYRGFRAVHYASPKIGMCSFLKIILQYTVHHTFTLFCLMQRSCTTRFCLYQSQGGVT
jgi:hypothetical protein